MGRLIDADALEKEGWSLHRTIRVDMNTEEYQTKPLKQVPTIEPRCETCEAFNKTRLLIPQPDGVDLFPAVSEEYKRGYRDGLHDKPEPQIVQCKDCKYYSHPWYCEAWNNSPGFPAVSDDMFCSLAERREQT